jgi:hypothetical protein
MDRRSALKSIGMMLTGLVVSAHLPVVERLAIGPLALPQSVDFIGRFGARIMYAYEAMFVFGDQVNTEEFQGWAKQINTM